MMIDVDLMDPAGAMDLGPAASVLWRARNRQTGQVRCGKCGVKDASQGKLQLNWLHSGTYDVEFEVHWSNDLVQTVPNGGVPLTIIGFELGDSEEAARRAAAAEWLTKYLHKNGPMLRGVVMKRARKAGMDKETLQRAARDMSVLDTSHWRLPDGLVELIDATPDYWAKEIAKP